MSWDCRTYLKEHLKRVANRDFNKPILAFDLETDGLYGKITLAAWADETGQGTFDPFGSWPGRVDCHVTGHNFKYDLRCLIEQGLIGYMGGPAIYLDTLAAGHMNNEEEPLGLKDLAPKYVPLPPGISALELKEWSKGWNKGNISLQRYAEIDVIMTRQLMLYFWKTLPGDQLQEFLEIECPMMLISTEMEIRGMKIDRAMLMNQALSTERDIQQIESNVKRNFGGPWECQRKRCVNGVFQAKVGGPRPCVECDGTGLNLKFFTSGQQIADYLYNVLKLPVLETTAKGNPSTSEYALKKLLALNQNNATNKFFLEAILKYRELSKLHSGFYMPYLQSGGDVIHCTLNPWGTVTGRWSCSNPNLQQVPASVRPLFIAREGHKLVSIDLEQAELYLAGKLYHEPKIVDAYAKREDLHTRTASIIFKKPPSHITDSERSVGKTVNFALLYGLSTNSLADRLAVSKTRAKEIMSETMRGYSGLEKGIRETKEFARRNGYVKTVSSRVRHLPGIGSSIFKERIHAENQAVNAPIQGSVGYLVKKALLNCKLNVPEADPLLQVHDELVFEVTTEDLNKGIADDLVNEVTKDALGLRADVRYGDRWGK